jgi:hypothetical protein
MTAGKHVRQLCGAPIREHSMNENRVAHRIALEDILFSSGPVIKVLYFYTILLNNKTRFSCLRIMCN